MNFKTLEIVDSINKNKNNASKIVAGNYSDSEFTIAIPLYGYAVFLEDTFKSIKNSFILDFKVQIVISDTKLSNEDDSKIIDLAARYFGSNFVYLKSIDRLSQYDNFNRCIELAHTDYVAMIHNDDLLSPDYFRFAKNIIYALDEQVGMICGKRITFTKDMPIIGRQKFSYHCLKKIDIAINGISLTGIPSCGTIFNKDIFLKFGGFDKTFNASGDAFLGAKMLLNNYKVLMTNNVTGFYRIGDNSSLRIEISRNFIIQDCMFRNDIRTYFPPFLNILLSFYENYFYSKSIDYNVKIFGKFNKDISIDNLDYLKTYKHYHKFGFYHLSNKMLKEVINFQHKIFSIKVKE